MTNIASEHGSFIVSFPVVVHSCLYIDQRVTWLKQCHVYHPSVITKNRSDSKHFQILQCMNGGEIMGDGNTLTTKQPQWDISRGLKIQCQQVHTFWLSSVIFSLDTVTLPEISKLYE